MAEDTASMPIILVHQIGARSGLERVTPLTYTRQADGSYVIVASNGGSPVHPSWYYNLRANPRTEVEVDGRTFTVLATELGGAGRAALWPRLVAAAPSLREFEATTAREIPVFVLTRT